MFPFPIFTPALAWRTLGSYTPDTNKNGFNTYGFRVVIAAAAFAYNGNKMRFTFQASSTASASLVVSSARVYEQAAAGDAYDGNASNNADITFSGGGSSGTISTGSTLLSDEISTTWFDNTKALVIAFGLADGLHDDVASKVTVTNWETYIKSGGSTETDTANVTGYTADNDGSGLVKVEVFG